MKETTPVVFVVDDDPSARKGLARLLRSAGMAVEAYGSAEEFLEREARDVPRCLVLDVRMPGVDGPDLQRRLKADGVDIPIVFLTGHGDVRTGVEAMKEGAVDFLEKPFEDTRLLEVVRPSLSRARA